MTMRGYWSLLGLCTLALNEGDRLARTSVYLCFLGVRVYVCCFSVVMSLGIVVSVGCWDLMQDDAGGVFGISTENTVCWK